jgi:hypothetical protein
MLSDIWVGTVLNRTIPANTQILNLFSQNFPSNHHIAAVRTRRPPSCCSSPRVEADREPTMPTAAATSRILSKDAFQKRRVQQFRHKSNQEHFHHVLLSNRSQFLVMLKFLVHIVLHVANCFHPYHLTQNRSWLESKLKPFILHRCRQFLYRGIPRSSLAVHFHANVLSGMVGADAEVSERRRVRESG